VELLITRVKFTFLYSSIIKLKGLQWLDQLHRPSILSLVNSVQHMFTHSRVV